MVEPHRTLTSRIVRSASRMNGWSSDLLDFTRTQLGSGVPIARAQMDLARMVRNAVEEVGAAHPERRFEIEYSGNVVWRMGRSANESGADEPSRQRGAAWSRRDGRSASHLRGELEEVLIIVHNFGKVIPPSEIFGIFSPFKRLKEGIPVERDSSNLGLGLFIADRIVKAHSGTIDVTSAPDAGTYFTIRLPRDATAPIAPLQSTSRTGSTSVLSLDDSDRREPGVLRSSTSSSPSRGPDVQLDSILSVMRERKPRL